MMNTTFIDGGYRNGPLMYALVHLETKQDQQAIFFMVCMVNTFGRADMITGSWSFGQANKLNDLV
jgi:hypothetical protein